MVRPSRIESSSPSFRAKPAAHADGAAPSEHLTNVRQKLDQPARGQRTRRTVDLTPATHRALDHWQREAANSRVRSRGSTTYIIRPFVYGLGAHRRGGSDWTMR
jgi:hypothetical protein